MRTERLIPAAVVIAATAALTWNYIFHGVPHEFITGEYKGTFEGDYDFTLELIDSVKRWGRPPLWSETYSGPIAVFASNFHVFAQGALFFLTGSLALSIKLLQVMQLLTAGLGMYLLSHHLLRDRAAASFSAVIYMFTPFYLGHLLSYLHYTGVYMLAPLVYYLMLRTVEGAGARYVLCLSLVMTYSLLSHPQNVFIGGIFYALFFLLSGASEIVRSHQRGALPSASRRVLFAASLALIVTLLLSSFLVLPTLVHNYPYLRTSWIGGAAQLVKVDTGHIGTHSQTLLAAISLQHWPWLNTPLTGGELPPWYYMAVYMMPFSLAALSLLVRCDRVTVIFLIMALLSVQISQGVKGRPDIFTLASRHLPFFGMSRTPYTYINHAILVMCLFSSITFSWMAAKVSSMVYGDEGRGQGGHGLRWVILALFVVPYLLAARFYSTEYNWTFIPARQPRYLGQVWEWMAANNTERNRVIETCGIPTAMLLGQRMLPNGVELLERFHGKDYLERLLSLFGFRYVITPTLHTNRGLTFDRKGYRPPSVFKREDGMEQYYSALTTEYLYIYERLIDDPAFRLHRAGTKDVAIFENTSAFGDYELYPAGAVIVLGGTDGFDLLSLERFRQGGRVAPVFLAQSANLERLDEIRDVATDIVFHNTDALDLFMTLNRDKLRIFQPTPRDPWNWEAAIRSFGIQQPFPQHDHSIGNSLFGELTFSDLPITAKRMGSAAVESFEVKRRGRYRILVRSYGGGDFSNLTVRMDGAVAGTIDHEGFAGYRWSHVWEGMLQEGEHEVVISLDEEKPAYIDSVAVLDDAAFSMYSATRGQVDGLPATYIINYRKFVLEGSRAVTTLRTLANGVYAPSIRLAMNVDADNDGEGGEGAISLYMDGVPVGEVAYSELSGVISEFRLPDTRLNAGEHRIEVRGLRGGVFMGLVALSDAANQTADTNAATFDYERTGPSSYRVAISSTGKTFLVLNETNYPGWGMDIDGSGEEPVITNMFMNGFIVPEGERVLDIRYSNAVQKTGVGISIAALLFILLFLLFDHASRRRRKGRPS